MLKDLFNNKNVPTHPDRLQTNDKQLQILDIW